jgi:hypothetical protein
MIDPEFLLKRVGDQLNGREPGAPSRTMLRRAVSDLYYAIFHEICRQIADLHVGVGLRRDDRYALIYRALEHGRAKDVLRRVALDSNASNAARMIADAFMRLQEQRHKADYDPRSELKLSQVRDLLQIASDAIAFLRRDFADKALLLTRLLVRERG